MADDRTRDTLHNVTSAYQSRNEELDARRRRYMITMGGRVVLFTISIVFFVHTPWLLYPSMAVSMVLPYVAVVFANGGRKKPVSHDAYVHEAEPMAAIGAGTRRSDAGHGRTIDAD